MFEKFFVFLDVFYEYDYLDRVVQIILQIYVIIGRYFPISLSISQISNIFNGTGYNNNI